jgi:methionine sulfoxide reductase heme-binding subunit
MYWPWQDANRRWSWVRASVFALMFVPALWVIYQYFDEQFGTIPLAGLTYWSGVWATSVLVLALAVTPAMTILRWKRLIDVRRMIGVTALFYTMGHIVIYFALRRWNFPNIGVEMVTRLTLIVASISTFGLIVLGATSFDGAVRRMGAKGWQQLHNAVYVTSGLAILHYLLSPGIFPDQYLMSGMFFWLMAWRGLKRHGLGRDVRALAILAVVSSIFTALFEAAWIWIYHGYKPSETLADNFTMVLGVPPPWTILVLGLLIAVASVVRRVPPHRPTLGNA